MWDSPLNAHKMAMATMIMISRPSSHKASQIRNCWEKGTVLTNKVMYHFVPQAEEDIIFRCYVYVNILVSACDNLDVTVTGRHTKD